ncbi:hypothetical protein [Sorangium sp. So ce1000]|uniref:hypothetical protein n=1 Tax=Sorangium sp. So ce1000 TaxID=3133325 RepID=UPI003F63AA9A
MLPSSTVRLRSILLAAALSLESAACPERPDPDAVRPPASALPATAASAPPSAPVTGTGDAGVPAAPASNAPGQSSAAVPAAPHPADFATASAAIRRACAPVDEAKDNVTMKEQMLLTSDCLRRRMVRELDAFLLPLKGGSLPRFKGWMKSQADWNRFVKSLALLDEELQWVNLAEGSRLDGTGRGVTFMACEHAALVERFFFARALAGRDPAAFARRVEALQSVGRKARAAVAEVRRHAAAPPNAAVPPDGRQPMARSEWKDLATWAKDVDEVPRALAAATCELWPEAAAALGGSQACSERLDLYYIGHCALGEP